MKKGKRSKVIRWLVYLVLVTSVITSVSLARYSSGMEGQANAVIASFTTGTTLDLDVPLNDLLAPGSTKTIDFTVANYNGETKEENDLLLGYEIRLETTGNLPLEFSLAGEKKNTDGSADADVTTSVLADYSTFSATLTASGGKLPPVANTCRKDHRYTLTVHWPESETDQRYSDEIDRVTIKITSTQIQS